MISIDIETGYGTRQHGFASTGNIKSLPFARGNVSAVITVLSSGWFCRTFELNPEIKWWMLLCHSAFVRDGKSLQKAFPRRPCVIWSLTETTNTKTRFAESWSRLCHMGVSEILGKMTVNQWNFGRFTQISRSIWTASRSAKKICRGWGGWCRILHPRGLIFTGITLWA